MERDGGEEGARRWRERKRTQRLGEGDPIKGFLTASPGVWCDNERSSSEGSSDKAELADDATQKRGVSSVTEEFLAYIR